MYGYINEKQQFVRPDSVGYDDIIIVDPTDEQLANLGYLLRVDTKPPAETGYVAYYVEMDGKAVQYWRREPDITTTDDVLNALLGVTA